MKVTKALKDLYADRDFGTVLNCAVRYSIGRRSYMPSLVVDFITPLLPYLNSNALYVFDQDITDARHECGYGDPCDERVWMDFHEKVKTERVNRGEQLYKDWRADEDV